MIFVDSSVILNVLFRTELTDYALEAIASDEPKITSETVIDEVYFVALKRKLVEGKVLSAAAVRRILQRKESARRTAVEILARVVGSIRAMGIVVASDSKIEDLAPYVEKYGLMPHDAKILATAISAGADKLAVLDTDFRNVEELELVPVSFWKGKV